MGQLYHVLSSHGSGIVTEEEMWKAREVGDNYEETASSEHGGCTYQFQQF